MKTNQQFIKLEYSPCSSEFLAMAFYLIAGSVLLLYGFIQSITVSTNLILYIAIGISYLGFLYKVFEWQRNNQPKHLHITSQSVVIPNKINRESEEILFGEIYSFKLVDSYIELQTKRGFRNIDCNWISDKVQLNNLIKVLSDNIPQRA